MPRDRPGPAELVLAAAVARRYYLARSSKVEIADALGISRFKVARLIEQARDAGLVRIEIVADGEIDLDRSARLQESFGLRHVVVVAQAEAEGSDAASADLADERLGRCAARLLSDVLGPTDVLGLPWSRSVDLMSRYLRDLSTVDVVQLSGAMEVAGHDTSAVDIVRRAARVTGGESSIFHAPLLLDDAGAAQTLRCEAQVARVLVQAKTVTVAVMGVGGWAPGLSTLYDAATPADRAAADEAGVVGEIGGVFFDERGDVLCPPLAQRVVTVDAETLRGIREVIALAAGAAKAPAVRAALRGGLANALVADVPMADALLADAHMADALPADGTG